MNNVANAKIKGFAAAGFFCFYFQESKHEFLLQVQKIDGLKYHQYYFRSNINFVLFETSDHLWR